MFKKITILFSSLFLIFSINSQSTNAVFDFSQVGEVRAKIPKEKTVKLCLNDLEGHIDIVGAFAKKYFDGNISEMLVSESDFTKEEDFSKYENCNVVNYSIGVYPLFFGYSAEERQMKVQEFKTEEYENVKNFLDRYEGFIVAASGNEDNNTLFASPIARYKEQSILNGETQDNYRLFVIGQIEANEDGSYIHHFSYGDQIDFVVPNYNEGILSLNEKYKGTSFAAPVVSSLISTMLEAGIPKEKIREVFVFEEKTHSWLDKEYKVLSVMETLRNTYNYIQ